MMDHPKEVTMSYIFVLVNKNLANRMFFLSVEQIGHVSDEPIVYLVHYLQLNTGTHIF